jgi:hypothetical protein
MSNQTGLQKCKAIIPNQRQPKKQIFMEVSMKILKNKNPLGEMNDDMLVKIRDHIDERKKEGSEDQRHRYPINVNGKTWKDASGFEPNSFLITLRELQQIYLNIRPLI